ncbi:hydroxymethylglutaryl-CoA synthase [Starmerella bacillaris]|uniref:Hydroxymethylglutaryl-CoA synthase n=1 Tax=Starmerella bacillaris TaxID=1247836 RepID=A0AAV5RCS5_STABA|nr:hydroxymethylglutaryl-CoA synthase [Starmerella bacillaris]
MSRPTNIGIKALEVYIPSQYVKQDELEKSSGVAPGKFTIGLGQTNMAFVNDREDIYSMSLTVLKKLLEKHNVDPKDIGRLEVGTETLLDKSKSVKSVLMQLLGDNHDVEGIDTVNACYGGTNALFNAVNWVDSSSWDGRYAVVVCGDIAIYAKGPARPTGGSGTVAMLIGPDAPLVVEPVHGSYMEHAYDFYKPDFTSEYPVVDGHYSLTCYTKALDQAYQTYLRKTKSADKGLSQFGASSFHVPTCKLVSKSFGRLLYNDYLNGTYKPADGAVPAEVASLTYEKSLVDKDLEKLFVNLSKEDAKTRLSPSLVASTNVGNIYTGSVYLSLASTLTFTPENLVGKRISMFSYGSGLAASFYSIKVAGDYSKLIETTGLKQLLDERTAVSPEGYEAALHLREQAHLQKGFEPKGDISHLRHKTFYLVKIDDKFQRFYQLHE